MSWHVRLTSTAFRKPFASNQAASSAHCSTKFLHSATIVWPPASTAASDFVGLRGGPPLLAPHRVGDDAGDNSLAYERLAQEGRKFGLALWLSTQRRSEISPTVLSQCNNWVSFRLTSEKDLAAIQSASEWADRREIRGIAGLPRQTAIVFGGSISMPTLLRAPNASPKPRSGDAEFGAWAEVREPGGFLMLHSSRERNSPTWIRIKQRSLQCRYQVSRGI